MADSGALFEDVKEYVESGQNAKQTIHFGSPEETKLTPMTRTQREDVPGRMAAQLMDMFIETLNDLNTLNPVRDGIPQCRNHPFLPPRQVGCIHSCAKRDPNKVLPTVKDYTLGDVFEWVKAIVTHGVANADKKKGWYAPDLAR